MTRFTSKDWKRAQANDGKIVRSEDLDRKHLIAWLKMAHPDALFKVNYGDDANLSGRQAKEQRELSCATGWPDLMIYEPRGVFVGLGVELKREDVKLYNRSGLFGNEHLRNQARMHELLRARMWDVAFLKGFLAAMNRIETYLNLPNPAHL